ncbi:MAG TPA: hypothetical protein VNX86_11115 [Rhizomicrobium sp.]|nr:hypothetical protein [Rhizomicrobium sp.]
MRVSVEANEEAGRPLEALDRMEVALNRQSLYDRFQALAGMTEKSRS